MVIYPLGLTLLTILMFFNWIDGPTDFTLFCFGFVSGVCVASWAKYLDGVING